MQIADYIAEWLSEKDITTAFGIIGAGNLAIWDAITRLKKTELVCVHHEQAAAMASTYFNRTRGRIESIVISTSGAGACNTLTGVLAAFMDSVPLLVISGNEPDTFFHMPHPRVIGVQGFDPAAMVKPIVKYSVRLCRPVDWPIYRLELDDCYKTAMKPRQGPVWFDIPRDIQVASWN